MSQCQVVEATENITRFDYDVGQATPYRQYMSVEGGEQWLTGLAQDNQSLQVNVDFSTGFITKQ
ncbi:hypothetical protein [Photobacterium lutimaris]|uniref:Uncharacterized protein n=1 Tax=Photobacterium lutimaris TaxID=388278 RepID=A0A2T3IYG4_9GAMM|nr:hypothetical protein [Photobacterium lutimaris]PSU33638.1 hypothetical protein C9I99_12770 [Photobacterium lutimaris]TDR74512.1 hypothetical protein DFP78_10799 [Photobacterium lutimaris]